MNIDQVKATYPATKFYPVLISEVTRMSKGNYCVAGWDIYAERMVRPLQPSSANWNSVADRIVYSVGNLVNCIPSGKSNIVYPHASEDLILSATPTLLEKFDEGTTYNLLLSSTVQSVRQLYGRSLVDNKYIPDGTVCRSLGGVRAARVRLRFIEDSYRKLRLQFTDNDGIVYQLPVTCDWLCRLFSQSDEEIEPHFGVPEANEWLCVNPPETDMILRVGLARGWGGKDGDWYPRRCYSQLNGIICPADNFHIFAGPPSL